MSIVVGERVVRLAGELRLEDGARVWRDLIAACERASDQLDLDLAGVTRIDASIAALVVELHAKLVARGVRSEILHVSPQAEPLFRLLANGAPKPAPPRERALARLGRATRERAKSASRAIEFTGELTRSAAQFATSPSVGNWRSLPKLIERGGIDGVPIVLLLDFLVGFVMAFQSARQLERYGANVYVADVVGISVARELGPLMTAIIMSGRSGAAYAAELGTMRVSEEIDALRTMGFSPVSFLVVPRVVALAIVAPALTLLGDVVGVIGGATVAASTLNVGWRSYLAELRIGVTASDVWTGIVKSVFFGIAIALIGCRQGVATSGAAEGVGRSTTRTVVVCLFAIVIIDTLFTMLFRELHR